MKKRAGIVCAVWMAAVLCGCSMFGRTGAGENTEEYTDVPKSQQTVLNWAVWDREIYPVWDALKEAFEAENPGVTIEIKDLGSLGYMNVLLNDLLSGEDYDIITTSSVSDYVMLCQKKQLLPLNYYMARDKTDLSLYNTDTENLCLDGTYYQMPFQNEFWMLFYNQDLFDRQRIAYPSNDMTMEDYADLVAQMTSTESSKRIYGTYYHIWPSVVRAFALLGEETVPSFTSFAYMEPYYAMISNQEEEESCQDYIQISTMGTNYAHAFSNGDIAMMPMGSWMIAELVGKQNQEETSYQKWNGKNWGIARMPRAAGRDPYEAIGSLRGLAVHASTKNTELAWKFLEFACGEEGARIQASYGSLPALYNEEIREILTGIEYFPDDESSREVMDVRTILDLDAITGYSPDEEEKIRKALPEIHTIWEEYHKKIMSGNQETSEALLQLEEEVQAIGNESVEREP